MESEDWATIDKPSQPGSTTSPTPCVTIITVYAQLGCFLYLKLLTFITYCLCKSGFQRFVYDLSTWQNYPVRLSSKITFMYSFLRNCGTQVSVFPHFYNSQSIGLYLFLGTSVFSHCALHVSLAVTSLCPFPSKESGHHLASTFCYLPLLHNLAFPPTSPGDCL